MSAGVPSRSEAELSDEQRREVEQAHADLLDAVATYEALLGRELKPDEAIPIVPEDELRAAQEEVESAETRLWDLRERLLGWSRPSWAPPATLVSDWILEDDPGYDDEPDVARP